MYTLHVDVAREDHFYYLELHGVFMQMARVDMRRFLGGRGRRGRGEIYGAWRMGTNDNICWRPIQPYKSFTATSGYREQGVGGRADPGGVWVESKGQEAATAATEPAAVAGSGTVLRGSAGRVSRRHEGRQSELRSE